MSTRLLRIALLSSVALACALTTANASASWLQFSPGGAITATSLGAITFDTDALIDVACNLTLTGTLETDEIEKRLATPFGSITNIAWANCTSGASMRILNLPWPLFYESITGTLPSATGLKFYISSGEIQLNIGTTSCLYNGSPDFLLPFVGSAPFAHGLLGNLGNALPLWRGPGACAGSGRLRGSFRLAPAQTITRIS